MSGGVGAPSSFCLRWLFDYHVVLMIYNHKLLYEVIEQTQGIKFLYDSRKTVRAFGVSNCVLCTAFRLKWIGRTRALLLSGS